MKNKKLTIMKNTITTNIFNRLAKHYWNKLETIENMRCTNIDELANKADAYDKLVKAFNRMPKPLRNLIGNSRKSYLS